MRSHPLFYRLASPLFTLITLAMYIECGLLMGAALTPSAALFFWVLESTATESLWVRSAGVALSIGLGYFLYGLTLIFVVALVRKIFFLKSPPGRHPYYSLKSIQWASYNSLILLVRFTFMNFLRPTPLLNLFCRMMGAKIGRRVHINTCIVADCNLLEIGDNTMIGGDATIIGHVGESHALIVEPVRIGRKVTIGLNTTIFPGVTIGDGVTVGAHSLVPKGRTLPPNTRWAGVPVRQLPSPSE